MAANLKIKAIDQDMSLPEHNGWPNFATWVSWLHITNDQGSYNKMCELARTDPNEDKVSEFIADCLYVGSPTCYLMLELIQWGRQMGHNSRWALAQIDVKHIQYHLTEIREEIERGELA